LSEFDLVVVGGGPAGLAASITASRAGARTLILERGQLPRHRVCGEFVSSESLSLLSSLLSPEFAQILRDAPRINSARLFVDDSILTTTIQPAAASIARYALDSALWRAAVHAGTDARQQVTVRSIEGNSPFHVFTSVGDFVTKSVIDASGRWSNLRSIHPREDSTTSARWIGLKAHFFESETASSVDLYFFPGGYCGVQPVGDAARNEDHEIINACAMVRADVATTLPEVLRCHPSLLERSKGWKQAFDTVATSPLIFTSPEPVREGTLMAGDSVAFVDPFVGDGISLALRSGALASESLLPLIAGTVTLEQASRRYEELYVSRLAPIFRASSKIRRLFALPRPVRKGLLRLFEKTPTFTQYIVHKTR